MTKYLAKIIASDQEGLQMISACSSGAKVKVADIKYLKSSKINWPAIKLDQKKSVEKLTKLGETGFIPNVVMLKPDGSMVSNDRAEVLKRLDKLTSS